MNLGETGQESPAMSPAQDGTGLFAPARGLHITLSTNLPCIPDSHVPPSLAGIASLPVYPATSNLPAVLAILGPLG